MESNIEPGKLFVGGLSWETTKEKLTEHFGKFGEVEECVIMKDQNTGNPRGFGFVQFKDPQCVVAALSSGPHVVDKKTIDPKQATAKGHTPVPSSTAESVPKKVFIGGVPPQATEDDIKAVFSQFGVVSEVVLKTDKTTNKMRGFGFVAFEDSMSAAQAVNTHYVSVLEKRVEIKAAEPRYSQPIPQGAQGGQYYGAMPQYAANNWTNPSRSFGYQGFYTHQTAAAAQQHQYSGTASGQYAGFPTGYNSQQYAGGYGATTAQRYAYDYPTAAQQHSYPQDTNSYGAANPSNYPPDAYSSAAGYSYPTDQVNSYHQHYDQTAGVASTAGYPRAAQTQQRGTAAGVYNNFGAAR